MDYAPLKWGYMFTKGQKERMHALFAPEVQDIRY
jgi:hypothetical protein